MIAYDLFLEEWNTCLSNRDVLFSSLNLYNILKYFGEYWRSSGKNDFSSLEKQLCDHLKNLISDTYIDFCLLRKQSIIIANEFEDMVERLSKTKKMDKESIITIDTVLKILSSHDFLTKLFLLIFDFHGRYFVYTIRLILRILIEQHTEEFLKQLPKGLYLHAWLNANQIKISQNLDEDRDLLIMIFSKLRDKTNSVARERLKDPCYKKECLHGNWSLNIMNWMEDVSQYLIEQLSNIKKFKTTEKGINEMINGVINRTCIYYYHSCFKYLINHIHDPPHCDLMRRELYANELIKKNLIFSTFFKAYDQNYGLTSLSPYENPILVVNFIIDLYKEFLLLSLKQMKFDISSMKSELRDLIRNSLDHNTDTWMFLSSFKENIMTCLINQLNHNFERFLVVLETVNPKVIENKQIVNFLNVYFMKVFFEYLFKEVYRFNKFNVREENFQNLDYNLFVKLMCNSLFSGSRKFRIFLSIRGFDSNQDLLDLEDIKIYNDRWNFYERNSFLRYYNLDRDKINKFKFKICIDLKVNNIHDALALGRQKCNDVFSNIIFAHKIVFPFDKNKKFLPEIESFFEILDIPLTSRSSAFVKEWPIGLDENCNKFLKENYSLIRNNDDVTGSYVWFREGAYNDSEFSKFLAYWAGLESTIKRIKKKNGFKYSTKSIYIHNILNLMFVTNQDLCRELIQRFKPRSDLSEITDISNELKFIFQNNEDDEIERKIFMLCDNALISDINNRKFVLYYLYKKRNAIIHEGETFSFEIIGLSNILEKYLTELMLFFR